MSLSGKRIVVGITGGIAAYKTIEFIRLLRKSNAEVRVALTPAAAEFVTPLTLQAISGNAVSQSLLDPQAELAMGHIELAKWADAIVIAPASADFIARLTVGMANDLLSTICLATSAPILLARQIVLSKSFAIPTVKRAIKSALAGAITIASAHLASSICPMANSA